MKISPNSMFNQSLSLACRIHKASPTCTQHYLLLAINTHQFNFYPVFQAYDVLGTGNSLGAEWHGDERVGSRLSLASHPTLSLRFLFFGIGIIIPPQSCEESTCVKCLVSCLTPSECHLMSKHLYNRELGRGGRRGLLP